MSRISDKIHGLLQLVNSNIGDNSHNLQEPQTMQQYQQLLEGKFDQLIRMQEQEQNKYQEAIDRQGKLKQQLADCIRQSHIVMNQRRQEQQSSKIKNTNTNQDQIKQKIGLKKQEISNLDRAIQQLQFELEQNLDSKTEIEQMGGKLYELQKEAEETKQQLNQSTQDAQQLNLTYSHLAQTLQTHKITHSQLVQRMKQNNSKQNQLQAGLQLLELEQQKLEQEIGKFKPKLELKAQKIQELDNLKKHIEEELIRRYNELNDLRNELKQLEEDLSKTTNFEKLIKTEKKADEALQLERKLLMSEFERICKDSGLEEEQQKQKMANQNENAQSPVQDSQEVEDKIAQNQDCVRTQENQINSLKEDIYLLTSAIQKKKVIKDQILIQYNELENEMDDLAKKFGNLNQSLNSRK